jgi:signal transduction histidine kinase
MTAGALIVAAIVGVVLFSLLTRRLRALSGAMDEFRSGNFTDPVSLDVARGGDDEIDRLAATFKDMSDRINQQVRALKQTDELRRELVANVSHDLRTPLASLTGYIETLQLKEGHLTDSEREEYLAIAGRQSERLGKLVEELFELARLESRDMEPDAEPFPLPDLVQDVVQGFQLQASDKGVEIGMKRPDEVPLVLADIGLIQRALQNLIGNALKYTDEGGQIDVAIEPDADTVTVRIEDTGCGIPDRELEQIFDRFYQARTNEEEAARPGGLGLAIVKRILELHGSAVEAASTVGAGTTFSFSLPVA